MGPRIGIQNQNLNPERFVSSHRRPGGPPLAALKLSPGPFPLSFELTTDQVMPMFRAQPLPDALSLGFRLDGDGDAITKVPGEPAATVETTTGTTDLAVTLE